MSDTKDEPAGDDTPAKGPVRLRAVYDIKDPLSQQIEVLHRGEVIGTLTGVSDVKWEMKGGELAICTLKVEASRIRAETV